MSATVDTPVLKKAPSTWRPDIQGLRALAVGLVIAAHAGLPIVEGGFIGVDVFFVISGFLITQLLLREAEKNGTVSISQFYVRRARRILPAATVVTVAIVLYATATLSLQRLHETTADAAWSSVFLANWHLGLSGTDYFSVTSPSLFQHYWSLAVEEQFYLIWPLLVLLFVPRFGKRAFIAVAGVVFVGSLAYSIWATGARPEPAYFDTAARAFELAAGALLGCVLASPLTSRWRHVAATAGILIIAYATWQFDEFTPFPGWHGLYPVVGTALLLAAGPDTWTGRILAWKPARYIGDISFSLYLWHWPVALAVEAMVPEQTSFLITAPIIIAISVALASLSFHLVEQPFQKKRVPIFSRDLRTLWLWPISVIVVVSIALGSSAFGNVRAEANRLAAEEYFNEHGYQTVEPDNADEVQEDLDEAVEVAESGAPIPPDIDADALQDALWTDIVENDCYASEGQDTADVCSYGDKDSKTTVALIGDSHASMWLPALDIIGKEHGFRVVLFAKMACGAYPVDQGKGGSPRADCDRFRDFTHEKVSELEPDAVLLGARGQLHMEDRPDATVDEQWRAGVEQAMSDYQEMSDRVIALGDVPGREEAPQDCVDTPTAKQEDCVVSGESIEQRSNAITREETEDAGAVYIDTEKLVCTEDGCPLFAGELPLYEDESHLNRLWVEHLAPALGRELEEALP